MKCPQCGCEKFYVKDPDDEYETYEFAWRMAMLNLAQMLIHRAVPRFAMTPKPFVTSAPGTAALKN